MSNIKYFNYIKEYGLILTFKLILRRLGIKIYPKIKYPLKSHNIQLKVYFKYFKWKNIEKGLWELNCINFFSRILKKNQIIFDVGAWVGAYTLLFSKLTGLHGKVYAFEPDLKAFNVLHENVKINKLSNIILENKALGDSEGISELFLFGGGGQSTSSLIQHRKDSEMQVEKIITTTIDKYCEANNIHPDGLKIDVEGAESSVIEGCKNTISRFSPWIVLEFHGDFMNENDRKKNWQNITKSSKKIIFLEGESKNYRYGSFVKEFPDCNHFKVFIQY
ncbi:MAG: FkbM family methyltransferase [Candidatus Odinarchaeota archaeon]